jgi:LacI family transcriptional regulator
MTVSRVINNSGYIGRETRSRVEAAIAELAYVPNAVGRQLRSKRTKMLALVLSDIMNPFFTTIARGVEDVARAQGFSVMFCNTDESEAEEARYLLMLVQRQVDGVLLVPASTSGKSLRLLSSHHMPVVVIDRRIQSRQIDSVRSDSEAGAYTLTQHLIGLGHRRIAVLTGRRSVSTSIDRVAGYCRAMLDAGLELDDDLVRYGEYNYGEYNQVDGNRMAQEVLAADPRPTAIFAANNFIAFGAMRSLRDAGFRVPEDMSIVAFDDLPVAWLSDPFMTVVDQPAYEIGRRAAELLLSRLDGTISGPGREVVLPSELIVRRSSGPPRPRPAAPPDSTAQLAASAGLPPTAARSALTPERVSP